MKLILKVYFVLYLTIFVSCSKVPVTGRRQVNMLPETSLIDMSLTSYRQFLNEHPPAVNSTEANMVKETGQKIAHAVEAYMKQNGQGARIKNYKWEFNLVNDNTVNAWCMPGGKVVVYSGLLPVTETETGLAFVMGHEIAHAVARHGNERMSQMMLAQMGGIALSVALAEKSQQTQDIFLNAYGIGTTVGVLLPFSRTHESEADKLGMIFMSMAGYDPSESIPFLERMAKRSGQPNMPEFLSTHPSDETRVKDAKAFLPKAQSYYRPAAESKVK